MVIRLLKNVLVLCCIKQALLNSLFQSKVVEATEAASENDLASEPRSVPELIEYWDYPGETHWIKTADNYILAVHRITGPAASMASEAATEASTSVRPIAFLQHGLFGTSARWTLGPPDKSLAYILADKGYDVWMGNTRGNSYSRNHTELDPDVDSAFWDFDLETASMGDLTATLDYVFNVTASERVFYICHSMGCAEILAFLSEFPEYNDRLDALFLMAPPLFMRNSRSRILTGIANLAEDVWGYYEIRRPKPRPWYINCQNIFCRRMFSRMLSISYPQLNMTMLPVIYDHLSHRSSSKVVYHFAQMMKTDQKKFFGKYDYGIEENQRRYNGSPTPPAFNLEAVSAPLYIFYGNGDKLVAPEDVKTLAATMPSTEAIYQIDYEGWNHNDFVYAIDAKKLVYDIIIQHMETIMDRPVGAEGAGGAWHTKILADELTNYLNQEV